MADKKSLVNIDFGGSSSIKNIPLSTAESGDYIAFTDEGDGGKVKKGPSFATDDGKFLKHDGTWAVPPGGTTKYHHHIVASWSAGSGSTYKGGVLSFDFEDTTSTPYDQSGKTGAQLIEFLRSHCGMTGGSGVLEKYPINGSFQLGSNTLFSASSIVNDYGSWYVEGLSFGSTRYYGSEYAWNWVPDGAVVTIKDIVL